MFLPYYWPLNLHLSRLIPLLVDDVGPKAPSSFSELVSWKPQYAVQSCHENSRPSRTAPMHVQEYVDGRPHWENLGVGYGKACHLQMQMLLVLVPLADCSIVV